MRIGPNERSILLRLVPDTFVPPSVYLATDYGQCPGGASLNSLRHKGLVEFQFETWGPEEAHRRQRDNPTAPGRETSEVNAALRPTAAGVELIRKLQAQELRKPAVVRFRGRLLRRERGMAYWWIWGNGRPFDMRDVREVVGLQREIPEDQDVANRDATEKIVQALDEAIGNRAFEDVLAVANVLTWDGDCPF